MGTVIQDKPHRHPERQPHGDRLARADLLAQYRALRTQGVSERQAATELKGPRTTLHAWRIWPATLALCPPLAAFFPSGPGLAFVHRIVMAFHLVCVAGGACGIRLVGLLLHLTGLNRFVAASYGAQQQVNLQGEHAMVTSRHDATARLAQDMPRKDLTVPQDATMTGGLCLVTMAPESNGMLVAQLAQTRDHVMGHALRAPARAQRNCRGLQSTRDAAPGLVPSVEPSLEAPPSPDWFQVQHALLKAVSGPIATQERAAAKAVTDAREQIERRQTGPPSAGDEPAQRQPGRPPKAPVRLEQAEQALEAASREHERLAQHRAQVTASLRGIGRADHCVALERGVRRHGKLIASAIHAHLDTIRTMAPQAHLSEPGVARLAQAQRVVPQMPATMEVVSGSVRQQGRQREVAPPASYARHATRIPS